MSSFSSSECSCPRTILPDDEQGPNNNVNPEVRIKASDGVQVNGHAPRAEKDGHISTSQQANGGKRESNEDKEITNNSNKVNGKCNGSIPLTQTNRLHDATVLHRGSKCRIVKASKILAVKQPHPIKTSDRAVATAIAGETEEEISQHEWGHFLKNEAQHRWEVHIYEILQRMDNDSNPTFHSSILPVPYISETGIYMLLMHEDLEQRMSHTATLPICDFQRVQWIQDVTTGLAWLETNGLVYCNLAPRHVLLYQPICAEDGGKAVLCDFSMTERVGGAMPTTYDLRDFRFLSTWSDERTSETDLWSLGCLGYFLITGHAPFAELQHRRAMNLLEEKWHPDFWNGEVSVLIPFVSRCWYCEHCAPRGNITPFRDLQEAARFWDEFVTALVEERNLMAAPMCRLSYHEQSRHHQFLERVVSRMPTALGGEMVQSLRDEARRIDRGEVPKANKKKKGPLNAATKKRSDRARKIPLEQRKSNFQFSLAVSGLIAATAVALAVYHKYFRAR